MHKVHYRMKRLMSETLLLILVVGAAFGTEPHFIDTSAVDAVALLPPPPPSGSVEGAADMDAVLQAQATRTKAEIARGKSEGKLSPVAFQSVLGADFTAEKFPHVYALLQDAAVDSKAFTTKAKEDFARPRPKLADPRVQPVNKGDDEPSYPSGHATRAMLWARILCEIAPDKKHELLDRAEEIGWDRVLIGAHYPSDVFAGEVLGQSLAQAMSKNADFQSRLAEAKEEYRTPSVPQPVAAVKP
jgi:acid phosphatase (class A)